MNDVDKKLIRNNNSIYPLSSGGSGINILTIDVEEWFHTCQSPRKEYIPSFKGDHLESRLLPQCNKLLHLLSKYQATGTFFVLGWVAQKHPELVRAILAAGHEIASHGYHHLRIDCQTPDDFRRDVKRSKEVLESIIGQTVRGYRAPCFSVTKESTWALRIIEEEGFDYDSSIHPLTYGKGNVPTDTFLPHMVSPGLREFPIGRVRIGGFSIPLLGGGYLRVLPAFISRYLIRKRNDDGQPAVVYLHPVDLDAGAPQIKTGFPQGLKRRMMRGSAAEKRLKFLLSGFRFRAINEVYNICADR